MKNYCLTFPLAALQDIRVFLSGLHQKAEVPVYCSKHIGVVRQSSAYLLTTVHLQTITLKPHQRHHLPTVSFKTPRAQWITISLLFSQQRQILNHDLIAASKNLDSVPTLHWRHLIHSEVKLLIVSHTRHDHCFSTHHTTSSQMRSFFRSETEGY